MSGLSTEQEYWSDLWYAARANIGSATKVYALLGYPLYDRWGRNCAAQHFNTNAARGSRPRDLKKRRLLEALGGPHARTIAVMVCIQRGLDPKKYIGYDRSGSR